MRIQNMKTKELAKWLHDSYEEIAKRKKWNTQEKCKVEFEDLPEENKRTMIGLARRVHNGIRIKC